MANRVLIATYWPYGASPLVIGDHHYARTLTASGYHVCVLAHPMSPLHLFARNNWWRLAATLRTHKSAEGVYARTPFSLVPLTDLADLGIGAAQLSMRLTIPPLKPVLERSGFDKVDVLWLTDWSMYFLRKLVPHSVLVARVTDDPDGWLRRSRTVSALAVGPVR